MGRWDGSVVFLTVVRGERRGGPGNDGKESAANETVATGEATMRGAPTEHRPKIARILEYTPDKANLAKSGKAHF